VKRAAIRISEHHQNLLSSIGQRRRMRNPFDGAVVTAQTSPCRRVHPAMRLMATGWQPYVTLSGSGCWPGWQGWPRRAGAGARAALPPAGTQPPDQLRFGGSGRCCGAWRGAS
jgi:hypothetical protein